MLVTFYVIMLCVYELNKILLEFTCVFWGACLIEFFFFFLEQFQVHRKIEQEVQRVPIYPHTCTAAQCQCPHRGLSQSVNLHRHVIITQSPDFPCVRLYSITQSCFTALKILCVLPVHPLSPAIPADHLSFHSLHSFDFSRMSYSWNHTVCSLFILASFT